MAISNPLGRLRSSFQNLSLELGINPSSMGNLKNPISAANSIYGSIDDQLSAYENFSNEYRRALFDEYTSGLMLSKERKRALRAAAKEGAQIDLSLITSYEAKERLRNLFERDILKKDQLIKNFGVPGIRLPSSNLIRESGKFLVSTEDGYQPFLDILQSTYFSIDPSMEGNRALESFRAGIRTLPSLRDLKERSARRVTSTGAKAKSPAPGKIGSFKKGAKLFFLDTETTGVTDLDIVRSISVGETSIDSVAGVKTVKNVVGKDLGARFRTTEMSQYVSSDPFDLNRVVDLGDAVVRKETFGTSIKDPQNIFDLKSEAGVAKAKSYYEKLLGQLSRSDSHLVAYNAQFDIKMLARSAREVGVDEAILSRFEDRMINGGAVDVLGMVREKLENSLVKRIKNSKISKVGDAEIEALRTLFSPEALARIGKAGEGVKPFSIENVIQSTNFLDLLARDAESSSSTAKASMNLLDRLATSQAAHIDVTDRQVAQRILEYIDDLDFRYKGTKITGLTKESMKKIGAARINVAASSAIIATTNLSDPRYLSQAAYSALMTDEGIQGVELVLSQDAAKDITPKGIGRAEAATLKFDPNSGSFRLYTAAPTKKDPFRQVRVATKKGFDAKDYVRSQIEYMRGLDPRAEIPIGMPAIQALGMSPIQATNIENVGRIISRNLHKSPLDALVNEEDFINAMVATRQHIGFGYMHDATDLPSYITRFARADQFPIPEGEIDAYRMALSKVDIMASAMNPRVRSAAVGMSTITSSLASQNIGFIRKAITETGQVGDTKASLLAAELESGAKYLSDLGMVTFKAQQKASAAGSLALIPQEILKEAKTLVKIKGKEVEVGFFDEAALAARESRSRISIATKGNEQIVNLIYGGRLSKAGKGFTAFETKKARKEAETVYDLMHEAVTGALKESATTSTAKNKYGDAFRKLGAENDFQAENLIKTYGTQRQIKRGRKVIGESDEFEFFFKNFQERGFGYGYLDEASGSRRVISVLKNMFGLAETEADLVPVQRGLVFSLGDANAEFMTTFLRPSDESVAEMARQGGRAGSAVIESATGPARAQQMLSVYGKMSSDVTFMDRIRERFSSLRINFGVGGTDFLADRMARDETLFARMKQVKPTIYAGLGAVAALSAGYYIARKQARTNLYDETMEEQPTEPEYAPMSIRDFNAVDQQIASQSSSRRDPLVTAGVVGNLDRNKISHYKMGPKKYEHLYGA